MMEFATWLSETGMSRQIQSHLWVIPALQSIHILAIACVLSSTLFINLRLLRQVDRAHSLEETAQRFLPWIWCALGVLVLTGVLLVIGEPVRELTSVPFWLKMVLILIGAAGTLWFQRTLKTPEAGWDLTRSKTRVRVFACGTFLLWCAVITAGRLIAYV
ncbi:MAG TPA: DUF6644 family protein [Rhizobiaceae bacterium]|nr:DUF6644 family protein [Rhizobiaceae bacterium]